MHVWIHMPMLLEAQCVNYPKVHIHVLLILNCQTHFSGLQMHSLAPSLWWPLDWNALSLSTCLLLLCLAVFSLQRLPVWLHAFSLECTEQPSRFNLIGFYLQGTVVWWEGNILESLITEALKSWKVWLIDSPPASSPGDLICCLVLPITITLI